MTAWDGVDHDDKQAIVLGVILGVAAVCVFGVFLYFLAFDYGP